MSGATRPYRQPRPRAAAANGDGRRGRGADCGRDHRAGRRSAGAARSSHHGPNRHGASSALERSDRPDSDSGQSRRGRTSTGPRARRDVHRASDRLRRSADLAANAEHQQRAETSPPMRRRPVWKRRHVAEQEQRQRRYGERRVRSNSPATRPLLPDGVSPSMAPPPAVFVAASVRPAPALRRRYPDPLTRPLSPPPPPSQVLAQPVTGLMADIEARPAAARAGAVSASTFRTRHRRRHRKLRPASEAVQRRLPSPPAPLPSAGRQAAASRPTIAATRRYTTAAARSTASEPLLASAADHAVGALLELGTADDAPAAGRGQPTRRPHPAARPPASRRSAIRPRSCALLSSAGDA